MLLYGVLHLGELAAHVVHTVRERVPECGEPVMVAGGLEQRQSCLGKTLLLVNRSLARPAELLGRNCSGEGGAGEVAFCIRRQGRVLEHSHPERQVVETTCQIDEEVNVSAVFERDRPAEQ